MSDSLRAMPLLERLEVRKCGLSGDKAALAVTHHPGLRGVGLCDNPVGAAGVRALVCGRYPAGEKVVPDLGTEKLYSVYGQAAGLR